VWYPPVASDVEKQPTRGKQMRYEEHQEPHGQGPFQVQGLGSSLGLARRGRKKQREQCHGEAVRAGSRERRTSELFTGDYHLVRRRRPKLAEPRPTYRPEGRD
jgi:hypothetical protein